MIGLRTRLLTVIVVAMWAAIVLVTTVSTRLAERALHVQHEHAEAAMIEALSGSLDHPEPLTSTQAERILAPWVAEGRLTYAAWIGHDGAIHWASEAPAEGDPVVVALDHGQLHFIAMPIERAPLTDHRRWIALYALVDALVLVGVGYVLLTFAVQRPIVRLARATRRVARGDRSVRVSEGDDELGMLGASFNTMVSAIDDAERTIRDQVQVLERANTELEQTQRELIQSAKMATVGQIAAGIAHEIGNPLAAVMAMHEIQASDLDAETRSDLHGRVSGELERIHGIVRGLLDYARGDDGERQPVHLHEVVAQALGVAAHHPHVRHATVTSSVPASLPEVHAHPGQLTQVVLNLVLNAAEATDGSGHITISAGETDDTLWLEVRDDGPGVPAEVRARLFEPFVTTKGDTGGTGLGLAVCERIVVAHGAELHLVDDEAPGAAFRIRWSRAS